MLIPLVTNCSYSQPVIHSITSVGGCQLGSNALEVVNCPRLGGANITLHGEYFGPPVDCVLLASVSERRVVQTAVVLIGGQKCLNVEQANQTYITCTLLSVRLSSLQRRELKPRSLMQGNSESVAVLIIQNGGKVSTTAVSVSYTQCQPGEQQQNLACAPCGNVRVITTARTHYVSIAQGTISVSQGATSW